MTLPTLFLGDGISMLISYCARVVLLLLTGCTIAAFASDAGSMGVGENVFKVIARRLKSDGRVGVLQYHSAACGSSSPLSSTVNVDSSLADAGGYNTTVAALRQLLAPNRELIVDDNSGGVVAIVVGNAWNKLGQVQIHHLKFNESQRYDPLSAFRAVFGSPESLASWARLRVKRVGGSVDGPLTSTATPRVTRLPLQLDDVNIYQALQVIAKTFQGLVVYEECTREDGSHSFDVDFVDGN